MRRSAMPGVGGSGGGNIASRCWPIIASITSGMVSSAVGRAKTSRPLRVTVTRSLIEKTSSSRCET